MNPLPNPGARQSINLDAPASLCPWTEPPSCICFFHHTCVCLDILWSSFPGDSNSVSWTWLPSLRAAKCTCIIAGCHGKLLFSAMYRSVVAPLNPPCARSPTRGTGVVSGFFSCECAMCRHMSFSGVNRSWASMEEGVWLGEGTAHPLPVWLLHCNPTSQGDPVCPSRHRQTSSLSR